MAIELSIFEHLGFRIDGGLSFHTHMKKVLEKISREMIALSSIIWTIEEPKVKKKCLLMSIVMLVLLHT